MVNLPYLGWRVCEVWQGAFLVVDDGGMKWVRGMGMEKNYCK